MSKAQTSLTAAEQAKQNHSTRHQWELYRSHRQQIERFIVPAERGQESICVLGAGNCNDLDLKWLSDVYREVALVDIDVEAPSQAARRQGVLQRVRLHAPVDLTGIAPSLAQWSEAMPSPQEVCRVAQTAQQE